ncbi:MAG: hypothetical protein AB1546_02460, partial [bacterium]
CSQNGYLHPMFMFVVPAVLALFIYLGALAAPSLIKWNSDRLFNNCRNRIEKLRIAELAYYRDNKSYTEKGLARYLNKSADSLLESWVSRGCRDSSGAQWRVEPMISLDSDRFVIAGYTMHNPPCLITATSEGTYPIKYAECGKTSD